MEELDPGSEIRYMVTSIAASRFSNLVSRFSFLDHK
jgi:hypothetical protein